VKGHSVGGVTMTVTGGRPSFCVLSLSFVSFLQFLCVSSGSLVLRVCFSDRSGSLFQFLLGSVFLVSSRQSQASNHARGWDTYMTHLSCFVNCNFFTVKNPLTNNESVSQVDVNVTGPAHRHQIDPDRSRSIWIDLTSAAFTQ
jgi:hypothetical protein